MAYCLLQFIQLSIQFQVREAKAVTSPGPGGQGSVRLAPAGRGLCLEMCREARGVVKQDWGTLAGSVGSGASHSAVHGLSHVACHTYCCGK